MLRGLRSRDARARTGAGSKSKRVQRKSKKHSYFSYSGFEHASFMSAETNMLASNSFLPKK